MRFMLMDNPEKQLGYSSIEEMCRWGKQKKGEMLVMTEQK